MTMISQFFSLEEAVATQHRAYIKANRQHAERYMRHVITHGRETMDYVRRLLGKPVIVSSWVRCPILNREVGGSDNSDHCIGPIDGDIGTERVGATDFICPSFGSPYDIAKVLSGDREFQFRQLIYEHTWVHVSSPRMVNGQRERPLRQVLTLKPGSGYAAGIHMMSTLAVV